MKRQLFIVGVLLLFVVLVVSHLNRDEVITYERWKLMKDHSTGIIYVTSAFTENKPWKQTKFKSFEQAKYVLGRVLRREAAEDATDDILNTLEN